MATEYLFSNNATTTLAQSVSPTATVLNVASGDGALFPSPAPGQAFAVTLVDAATGLTNEICYCTSRSGDQLTVIRGREGTNATTWQAGDTCANYITADVMESWLQESDLNGYVKSPFLSGDYQYTYIGYSPSLGGPYGHRVDGTTDQFALNSALQSEISRATTVESNLQSSKVNRAGDTMTGTLFQNLGTSAAVIASGLSGPASAGQSPWTPQFISQATDDGSLKAVFCARDLVGYYPYLSLQLTEQNGTWHELQFRNDDRLYTASGNKFALVSELNAYQPAGNYVTGLSAGKIMQDFVVAVEGSGVHDITFPQAFSGIPTTIVISHGLTDGRNDPVSVLGGWTATGFQIQTTGSTSVNFLAVGP